MEAIHTQVRRIRERSIPVQAPQERRGWILGEISAVPNGPMGNRHSSI